MNDRRRAPSAMIIAGVSLVLAMPATADLTLTGHSSVAALGMLSIGQEKLLLRKQDLRRDLVDRGRAYSYLFDLNAHQVAVLDHALRTAEVRTLGKADSPEIKALMNGVKTGLAKTGKQRAMQHWKCEEHSVRAEMPTMLGTDPATFLIVGTAWLAANTPEQQEMATLRQAAFNYGYLLVLPSMAQLPPDQVLAIGVTIRQLVDNGILCEFDVETGYEGMGRMVELARKVATRLSLKYEGFSTEKIPDDVFRTPEGYTPTKARQ
jgi:hypothetical protein